jgi:4-hydroxy-2-oxoheptanedioate aldolase
MRYSTAHEAPLVILHQLLPSPAIVRRALAAGYDGVLVDLDRGEMSLDTTCEYVASVPFGQSSVFAVVGSLEPGPIARLVAAGAHGVTLARVEAAAQVAALAERVGRRTGVVVGAQIETAAGLADAAAIAAAPRLGVLRLVPSRLATSLGLPGHGDWYDGPVYAAIERLSSLARERDVSFGVHADSAQYAAHLVGRGLVDYVVLGSDLSLLEGAMRDAVTDLAASDPLGPSSGWRIGLRPVAPTGVADDTGGRPPV